MKGLLLLASGLLVFRAPACVEHCHDEESCGDATAATGSSNVGTGGGGSNSTLAEVYCNCMLTACHDEYHSNFGPMSDELAARGACLAEADSLAVAGANVTAGDFVECRIHHCELGKSDTKACAGSIGEGACQ